METLQQHIQRGLREHPVKTKKSTHHHPASSRTNPIATVTITVIKVVTTAVVVAVAVVTAFVTITNVSRDTRRKYL